MKLKTSEAEHGTLNAERETTYAPGSGLRI